MNRCSLINADGMPVVWGGKCVETSSEFDNAAIGVWFGLRALITGPGRRRGFVSALVCAVANPFAVTAMLQWAEGWVIA